MSDLISRVKELYGAYSRGDVPTLLASLADDISWEVEAPPDLAASGIRHSPGEVVGFFTSLDGQISDPQLEMTEFLSGENTVAAFGRFKATVRSTGIRFDVPVAHFFRFRDGKIIRHVQTGDTGTMTNAIRGLALGASS